MNTTRHAENLAISYCRSGEKWSDKELLLQFVETLESEQPSECDWMLARWVPTQPRTGGLEVRLFCPQRELKSDTLIALFELLQAKLLNGLALSSAERGWPTPRFSVQVCPSGSEDEWGYQLKLGPFQTDSFGLHPNKILAVGDEGSLSSLLGLEATDPVFGLPAKWVTVSQADKASQHGCLIFESPEVIMGHSINFLSVRTEHALGLWEVNRWLAGGLPTQGAEVCNQIQNNSSLLLRVVRSLIAESLHLPPAERFSEHLHSAMGETSNADEIEMLVRKEVVNDNIGLWLDEDGVLNAIAWKGPEELKSGLHHRMLERLARAVEQVTSQVASGTPVLLVDLDYRQELASSLKGLFPSLPVLAWSDLKDLSNVHTVVTVNATLAVDPPPVPTAFFSTTLP